MSSFCARSVPSLLLACGLALPAVAHAGIVAYRFTAPVDFSAGSCAASYPIGMPIVWTVSWDPASAPTDCEGSDGCDYAGHSTVTFDGIEVVDDTTRIEVVNDTPSFDAFVVYADIVSPFADATAFNLSRLALVTEGVDVWSGVSLPTSLPLDQFAARQVSLFGGSILDECNVIADVTDAKVVPSCPDADGDGICDADEDDDGDGVSNANDVCADTPAGAIHDANGCSGAQLVQLVVGSPCGYRNHGQYVSAVTHAANDAYAAGLLTNAERSAIVSAAAHARCGG